MPFSKGSSRPRDQTHNSFSSCTGSDSLPLARPGKLMLHQIMSSQHIQTSDPIAAYTSLADGDCSHEIKRRLLLGRKVTTNLDSILKSTDITSSTKVRLVKAIVFPVVMYGCESWTVKKAERQRTDAFEMWCWRTLESPLDCKKIQSVHPKGDQS